MSDWKSIVKAVAPTLATALGGPLAGAAVSAVSSALLGRSDGTEADVAAAIASGSPDVLLKIKEADHAFKAKMAELGVNLERIAQEDRASARAREVQTQDPTTRRLAYIALLMFIVVLGAQLYMALKGVTINAEVQRTLDITLGVLFAWVLAVKDYYFGSSAGSTSKNQILDRMAK